MSDSNLITVRGRVGTDPDIVVTPTNRRMVRFRLGSTRSYLDTASGQWRDHPTEWFTVKTWGAAGDNVCASIRRGMPVIVQGALSSEEWTNDDGKHHTNVITARAIGVDVKYGEVTYTKVTREAAPADVVEVPEPAEAAESAPSADDDAEQLAPEPVDPRDWEKLAG